MASDRSNEQLQERPQLALILGGCERRELLAADWFAKKFPEIPILLSSGAASQDQLVLAQSIYNSTECSTAPVLIDCSAVDTVTNFTTTAHALRKCGISSVVIATAREHSFRAELVGRIILASHGVKIAAVHPVQSAERLHESRVRALRDLVRAVLFVFCGVHFGCLNSLLHPQRVAAANRWHGAKLQTSAGYAGIRQSSQKPLAVRIRSATDALNAQRCTTGHRGNIS